MYPPPQDVTLRRTVPSDAPAVTACVIAAYAPWVPVLGTEPGPMRDDYTDVLSHRQVFVAESGAGIVGVLVLDTTDDGFLLENVAVLPAFSGWGIGARLLSLAEHEACRQGHASIHLYTHERMERNIALYRRLGYVEFDRRTEQGLRRVYLRKRLAPRAHPAQQADHAPAAGPREESTHGMETYYARRATEYDAIYLKPERQADLRCIELWLPQVLAGRSVLEIACGTGYWTQFFAPRCPRVIALDAAPQTIDIARTRVPPETVEFVVGDAYDLPPLREPLEAGFAGFWWSHVPRARLRSFLQGFHAALVPGATVVFLDNRFVAGSSTPISARDDAGDTWQTRRLADRSSHRVLKNFPTEQELRDAVAPPARDVRYHAWDHYWALAYATAAR